MVGEPSGDGRFWLVDVGFAQPNLGQNRPDPSGNPVKRELRARVDFSIPGGQREPPQHRGAVHAYSSLMLASRITFPHLSVSAAMKLPKSAGGTATPRRARAGKRAFILRP